MKHHGDRIVFKDAAPEMETISPDADIENADWTKTSWDLPPYMSPDFLAVVPDVEAFKKTRMYQNAVDNGLIIDDEWAADHIESA